jgi:anhydro-N-acetylmuramic acid kinase
VPHAARYIGLMSGTSVDGIDGVLLRFDGPGEHAPLELLGSASVPMPQSLRAQWLELQHAGDNELHRAALAANALSRLYAEVVARLLESSGCSAEDIVAIGAHGQTVRHQPGAHDGVGYTLQLQNPALLAELTGVTVVADFRSRDVAAGGQGAPLVPRFHRALFGQSRSALAVLNLGGMANLSAWTAPEGALIGFDCGPANVLMDAWCQQHTGAPYDARGSWARQGRVHAGLLASMKSDPYFDAPPPKSTGRDRFNRAWLQHHLERAGAGVTPVDVQATLLELTAQTCAEACRRHAPHAEALVVCGGGACNDRLMERLGHLLAPMPVRSSAEHGLPPQWVEAAAFAWLARQTIEGRPGNDPRVTGARGPRILGAIYPR